MWGLRGLCLCVIHTPSLPGLQGDCVVQHFRDAESSSDGQFAVSVAGRRRIMLILISRLILMTAVWRVAEGKVTSRFICVADKHNVMIHSYT